MAQEALKLVNNERRQFIGGSDARIVMSDDQGALLQHWREKRGEVEPRDFSGHLIVQLGRATEGSGHHGTCSQVQARSVLPLIPSSVFACATAPLGHHRFRR